MNWGEVKNSYMPRILDQNFYEPETGLLSRLLWVNVGKQYKYLIRNSVFNYQFNYTFCEN